MHKPEGQKLGLRQWLARSEETQTRRKPGTQNQGSKANCHDSLVAKVNRHPSDQGLEGCLRDGEFLLLLCPGSQLLMEILDILGYKENCAE
jgi:hypothetical protein